MQNTDEKNWSEYSFVAFDLETSGAYPVGDDVVEFGAVKWNGGKIVERYQTLFKPRTKMSDFIIGIHGITNEMVENAPVVSEKIQEIRNFFEGSILMAHHAPFDMGFVAFEFEKNKILFPSPKVICTSLLARSVFPESTNHKLQTLIKFFHLPQGTAHRAIDDAEACLSVGIRCMERLGNVSLSEVYRRQGKELYWKDYCILGSTNSTVALILQALQGHKDIDLIYQSGSQKGETRRISPVGIVRNPDGDYVMAKCHRDGAQKRFYLNKITDPQIVFS